MNELNFKDTEAFEDFLPGCYVKFKDDLSVGGRRSGVGFCPDMNVLANKIRCVSRTMEQHGIITFEVKQEELGEHYTYDEDMIEEIYCHKQIKNSNNNIINFKKGDKVKIVKKEPKKIGKYNNIPIYEYNFEHIEEKEFIVYEKINDEFVLPYFLDDSSIEMVKTGYLELVEDDYITKISNKEEKTEEEKKILEDFEILEEMKNKVDVKSFKKIYAGSVKKIPKELKGIEKLLSWWALSKKEIYKMFDKELSIKKQISFEKTDRDMQAEREKLFRAFPRLFLYS